jgi:hypothetical protein
METRIRRWTTNIMILISVMIFLVPVAQAAEEHAGRLVQHTLNVETKEVGDVPGHITGVAESCGLIFFSKGPASGEIATTMATTHFDIVNGKGTNTSERVITYPDGSTLSLKVIGTQTPVDGGKRTAFEGSYEFTGGTGRYEGKEGKGTYKGERIGSPKTGGDAYFDFTGTEWKKK